MTFRWGRVGAIVGKELRDYRRNRFVMVFTMAVLPLIFITLPMVQLFTIKTSISNARLDTRIGLSLLYLLIIPTIIPSALSAYSVIGEREQGTLEPILTTPIHRAEFLIGKAMAAFIPAQQLSIVASLPPLVMVALLSLNVINASPGLALGLAAALLVFNGLAWRVVAAMFDRERLITGRR
jgi:ABC-type transport system involved in multi-copper enzyme maturation permease subunit